MEKKLDLLDRIDEVRAKSVTPEKFKETWGYSLEDHVEDMMDFIHNLEAEEAPAEETVNDAAETERILSAAVTAAAVAAVKKAAVKVAAKEKLKWRLTTEASEGETLETLMKKVQTLLKQMDELRNNGEIGRKLTQGSSGGGKEGQIVAHVHNSGKKGQKGKAGLKPVFVEPQGKEGVMLKDGVRGLMVDEGDLVTVLPGFSAGPAKQSKGRKRPKG